uniref:WAS protein family homolog 1 n=1 Tax=Cacopsylla melanoneura TaxID=428564 RepID=A0A8D8XX13_9HEMI
MTKLSKLEVPLVQDDLKYPETIFQIANTLDILHQSIRHVFDHVNKSIGRTRKSLLRIEERNNIVSAKIEHLRSIQKSVTITSKSKFPYVDRENFSVDFQVPPKIQIDKLPAELGALDTATPADIDSKLKFYHVKTGDDMLHKNVELVSEENLGKLPGHIESITSCMLFNTSENVYDKYIIVDPLSSKQGVKPLSSLQDNVLKMEDAPKSLLQEDDVLLKKQTFVYSPSVEEIPVIELPVDLPDLMGFADDFRYTGENVVSEKTVTPSQDSIPPINTNEPVLKSPPEPKPNPTTQTNVQQISQPDVSSKFDKKEDAVISPTVVPPPPPPPPMNPSPMLPPTPEPSSLHANLMQAIRNAGGKGNAKLKTVDRETSSVTVSAAGKTPTAPSGGDLMSDLAAKLSLRRKGISGSKENGGGSLMDKLLLNIPPPPVQGGGSSESEEEEQDEADWDD